MADESNLHVVEYNSLNLNYPNVLASPKAEKNEENKHNKNKELTFEEYIWNNKVIYKRPKYLKYEKLPSWQTHLKKTLFKRNHYKVIYKTHYNLSLSSF